MDFEQLDPQRLLKFARRWALPVLLLTVVGAAAGFAISKTLQKAVPPGGYVLIVQAPRSSDQLNLHCDRGRGCQHVRDADDADCPPRTGPQTPI